MSTFEHFVSGFTGGIVSTIVCHPLDLLKIRYSANEGGKLRPQYNSYWHAIKSIVSAQGFRGLYQGMSANITGAALSWGMYFEIYHLFKRKFEEKKLSSGHAILDNFMFGLASGASVMVITNPIWVTKTRLCLQYENERSRRYTGMIQCIRHTIKNEGFMALYKGFIPGLFGTVHGSLQFMLYNLFKDTTFRRLGVKSDFKLNIFDYTLYSAASKMMATTVTFPYQVLRTRLQDHHAQYKNLRDVAFRTLTNEGITGFYKGMIAANFRQIPAAIVIYLTYENVLHLLRQYR